MGWTWQVIAVYEGGSFFRMSMVSISLYLTISVAVKKKAQDSMYPMVMKRWDPNSCSLSAIYFGIRKAVEGISSRRNQMCM